VNMKSLILYGCIVVSLVVVGCGKPSEQVIETEQVSDPEEMVELKQFPIDSLEGIITRSNVQLDKEVSSDGNGSLRVTATKPGMLRIRLFEVKDIDIEEAALVYQARVRTEDVEGFAFLEMWCHFPGMGEYFSRGIETPLTGTTEWTTEEIPFFLKKGERPDYVKLNLAVNGKGTVWIDGVRLLKRPLPPGTKQASESKEISMPKEVVELKQFPIDSLEGIITRSNVQLDKEVSSDGNGSLRVTATKPGMLRIRLFEVKDIDIEDTRLTYQARVRTEDIEGLAYLEMWCHFPGMGEYFSRGLETPLAGTTDWTTEETPFFLKKGERPDNIKLNLVVDGKGTAWIDDVRLLKWAN